MTKGDVQIVHKGPSYIYIYAHVHTYNMAFNLQNCENPDNFCVSRDDVEARIMFLRFAGGHLWSLMEGIFGRPLKGPK